MDYQAELSRLVETYCHSTGRSEARVANLARLGSTFFHRLRAGARCWPETDARLWQWFSDNWPADLRWPDGISRPRAVPAAVPTPTQATAA